MASMYAGRSQKMLRRDLNELKRLNVVITDATGRFRPNVEIISAFLPARRALQAPVTQVVRG